MNPDRGSNRLCRIWRNQYDQPAVRPKHARTDNTHTILLDRSAALATRMLGLVSSLNDTTIASGHHVLKGAQHLQSVVQIERDSVSPVPIALDLFLAIRSHVDKNQQQLPRESSSHVTRPTEVRCALRAADKGTQIAVNGC